CMLFFILLTCKASFADEIPIEQAALSPSDQEYCVPQVFGNGNHLYYVSVGSRVFNHNGPENGYTYYSDLPDFNLYPNMRFFFHFKFLGRITGASTQYVRWLVWIDKNNDGEFTSFDLVYNRTILSSGDNHEIKFMQEIPRIFEPGTRMRVVAALSTSQFNATLPCSQVNNGEMHDYDITFVGASEALDQPAFAQVDPVAYCASRGDDVGGEYIERVISPNSVQYVSGDNEGYFFSPSSMITLRRGQRYTELGLNVLGDPDATYDAYIWIDWNQDGFFEPHERLNHIRGNPSVINRVGTSFVTPFNARAGNTMMRFQYFRIAGSDPCGIEPDGEVEDRVVRVSTASPLLAVPSAEAPSLSLFPNPAQGATMLKMPEGISPAISLEVMDQFGEKIIRQEIAKTNTAESLPLDTQGLQKGLYYVRVTTTDGQQYTEKLLIE
ncbi:MAG: GEVED domain-containing protein, partial [Bacteroidota bacterium]